MEHNDKFKIEQLVKENMRTVMLRGIIDEDANFDPLMKLHSPLVINFSGVTSINSCGVRNWVNLLKDLSGKEVFYEECPTLIVRQMNMVPSFVGGAKIVSVFAPYVCESCEKELALLVKETEFDGGVKEAFTCDACKKGEMEFDGRPDQYFAFLK